MLGIVLDNNYKRVTYCEMGWVEREIAYFLIKETILIKVVYCQLDFFLLKITWQLSQKWC